MKGGESGGETGMTEVPSDGDEGSSVFSLKPRSYSVDDVTYTAFLSHSEAMQQPQGT